MTLAGPLRRRIGLKVLCAFLAAIVPLIGVIIYCNLHLSRDALAHAREMLSRAMFETAAEQDGMVAELREMLGVLASLDETRRPDIPALTATLRRIKEKKPCLANLFLCGPEGTILASAEPGYVGLDVSHRKYFRDPLRRGGFSFGQFVVSRVTRNPAIHFSTPVRDPDGRISGVLVAPLDLACSARLFDRLGIPAGGFLEIYDSEGLRLLRYPPAADAPQGQAMAPSLADRLDTDRTAGLIIAEPGHADQILTARRLQAEKDDPESYGTLVIGLPVTTALSGVNRRLLVSVVASAASVLAAVGLAVVLGRVVIVGRLRVLADLVQDMERDRVCLLPRDFGEDEIGLLGRRLIVMSRELHEKSHTLAETLLSLRREKVQLESAVTKLGQAREELERRANHDVLTGLYNRRAFGERLGQECARSRHYGTIFSLVLFDIDDFKVVNDTLGHDAGDETLRLLGELVTTCLRESDSAYRVGGEEFALLLPATPGKQALAVAERLRENVARATAPLPGNGAVPITISLGLAECPHDLIDPKDLYKTADQALYRAKATGKNRSVLWIAPIPN